MRSDKIIASYFNEVIECLYSPTIKEEPRKYYVLPKSALDSERERKKWFKFTKEITSIDFYFEENGFLYKFNKEGELIRVNP